MPVIHLPFTGDAPIVRVVVGASRPRLDALAVAGQPLPAPVIATMLIDTGASGTAIDPQTLAPLGLTPTSTASVQTPTTGGTPINCSLYDVSLALPGPSGPPLIIDALPVIESVLKPQGIDGLLGRDVLDQCVLIYNAQAGFFTLTF